MVSPASAQPGRGVLPDGAGHPVAALARRPRRRRDQRQAGQPVQQAGDLGRGQLVVRADLLGQLQRPAGQHRQPAQQHLLGRAEPVMAPVDRGPLQVRSARRQRRVPAGQPRTSPPAGRRSGPRQHSRPGRRPARWPAAARPAPGRSRPRPRGCGASRAKPGAAAAARSVNSATASARRPARTAAPGGGTASGGTGHTASARPQRLTAGGDHEQARRGGQQPRGQVRAGAGQMVADDPGRATAAGGAAPRPGCPPAARRVPRTRRSPPPPGPRSGQAGAGRPGRRRTCRRGSPRPGRPAAAEQPRLADTGRRRTASITRAVRGELAQLG